MGTDTFVCTCSGYLVAYTILQDAEARLKSKEVLIFQPSLPSLQALQRYSITGVVSVVTVTKKKGATATQPITPNFII